MKPKYITLGSWRSGTSVIHESLELHPDLKVAYEIFHSRLTVEMTCMPNLRDVVEELYGVRRLETQRTFFFSRYGVKPDDHFLDVEHATFTQQYDLSKLVDYVFDRYNSFKILYCQIPRNYRVWDHLVEMDDLKVIHVHRRDYLAVITSLLVSYQSGVWNLKLWGDPPRDNKVNFTPDQLTRFFELMDFENEHFQALFEDHEHIIVDYDEINDWEGLMRKLQRFLGVPYFDLRMKYQKRTTTPIPKLIHDYGKLKQHFVSTKYRDMFP